MNLFSLEALEKWKDNEEFESTYENLLKKFIKSGYKTVANSIREVLEKKCKSYWRFVTKIIISQLNR